MFIFYLFLIAVQFVTATNSCGTSCTWELTDNNKILQIKGTGRMEDFYTDNKIPWIQNRETIETISIENGITYISQKSFQNMKSLKTINWGGIIEIGKGAFYNTGIEDLKIPSTVQFIGKNAFEQNAQLTSVTFDSPSKVETIESSAFRNCVNLKEITIPNSVRYLKEKVFEGCAKLEKITIGSNVEELGDNLFTKCVSLKNIIVDSSSTYFKAVDNVIYSADGKELVYYSTLKETKDYEILEGVETIRHDSFVESKLHSVHFPFSLRRIESNAFQGNRYLKQLTLPHYVEEIGHSAFAGCRLLENVTITSHLTIGDYVSMVLPNWRECCMFQMKLQFVVIMYLKRQIN